MAASPLSNNGAAGLRGITAPRRGRGGGAAISRRPVVFFWFLMIMASSCLPMSMAASSEHSSNDHGKNENNIGKSSRKSSQTSTAAEESEEEDATAAAASACSMMMNPTVTMATVRRVWRRGETDSVASLLVDLANLEHLKGQHKLLTPTHWKRDSSYTRPWTNGQWEFHQARALRRYGRHLLLWTQSPTARAVFPAVAALLVWSAIVFGVLQSSPELLVWVRKGSFLTALSSFTAPLSLLLALRTNRALDRLLEARSMWGTMVRATTTLAGLSALHLQPIHANQALLMGRYLSVFGWILKGHLREEDNTIVCSTVLPPEEAAWLEGVSADTPTAMIFRMRQILASRMEDLPWVAANAMEDRLVELEVSLGTCMRLLGSPIPPTYTRHTSRVLCLYLGLLPIALVGGSSTCGLLAILINVALLSYVFVGIDEIGVEIEHPFPLLPMYYFATVVQDRVGHQFVMAQTPPKPYQQSHHHSEPSSSSSSRP